MLILTHNINSIINHSTANRNLRTTGRHFVLELDHPPLGHHFRGRASLPPPISVSFRAAPSSRHHTRERFPHHMGAPALLAGSCRINAHASAAAGIFSRGRLINFTPPFSLGGVTVIGRRISARGAALHIMCTNLVTCIPSPKSQGTLLWPMELDDVCVQAQTDRNWR